jgi:protein-tyrosine-phosphatase
MRVVFLCTGNVNRSAAAHAVALCCGVHSVASAGTSVGARKRNRMAKRTRDPLLAAGIDKSLIEKHRSQHAGDFSFRHGDVVVGFQPSHERWASENAPNCKYVSFASRTTRPEWANKIPDPGFDASIAVAVASEIVRVTPGLCRELLACAE